MNRAAIIAALAACALLAEPGRAQTTRETQVLDALDRVCEAQLASDFPRLASLLHPASLRLFRNELSARFDQLLRFFPPEKVAAISGLPSHPVNVNWEDRDVFVAACNAERERHPDFVGNRKALPLKVRGTIFEDEKTAHVLFTYTKSVHTEHTDFDYVQPTVFTFHREGHQWLLYTCVLGSRITEDWRRDISLVASPQPQSEQP